MADVTPVEPQDFIPLFPEETEEAIADRWDAWTNEGLTPDDVDEWVDVRDGNFVSIARAPMIREVARAYDVMGSEYVAAGIPFWSWGEYLDDHAITVRLGRNAAAPASGTVTFTADDAVVIPAGTAVSTEATDVESGPQEFQTTEEVELLAAGDVDAPVAATVPGVAGNVAAGAITQLETDLPGATVTVTNADPIVGGADPESDEALLRRLLGVYGGQGPGNARDYVIWALAYGNGIGRATVVPIWDGPNTVLVIVLTEDGDPVAPGVVAGLQAFLDPVPTHGSGQAPVGPTVTVSTATAVAIDVSATVELETGYSLDGAAGTLNVTPAITAALSEYVRSVEPGHEVVIRKVLARIVDVTGVHDVGSVELDGAGANILLDDDPAQVGELGVLDLTAGAVP